MLTSSWLLSKRVKAVKDAERTGIKSGREVRPTHYCKAKYSAHPQLPILHDQPSQATKQAGIQLEETDKVSVVIQGEENSADENCPGV